MSSRTRSRIQPSLSAYVQERAGALGESFNAIFTDLIWRPDFDRQFVAPRGEIARNCEGSRMAGPGPRLSRGWESSRWAGRVAETRAAGSSQTTANWTGR